jgi:acetylornithine deacetylase/succinyl-diaminopimelate desuccinylase-like protein
MNNSKEINDFVHSFWDDSVLPTLIDYIKIPCLSVDFDPDWEANGYMTQAKTLALEWLDKNAIDDWKIYHDDIPGRSPLILIDIPGNLDETILLYGHLDKQPEMEGWWKGFGPWSPVIKDDKLYGRGGADDGYALFTSIAAIRAIKEQQLPHARIIILIEFSEESGSPDLPAYLDKYKQIIGSPDLVITLDSGAGDYQRLWSTTSLRGMLSCIVTVEVLTEATHSGIASGTVPSSMRIMRQLLDRLEDSNTGKLLLDELNLDIPEQREQQAREAAKILGDSMLSSFNTVEGLEPVTDDSVELLLNNAWRPTLCVVGQDGIPAVKAAGNVMRAYTTFKLSFRLPPSLDYKIAQKVIKQKLLVSPPYNSQVTVRFDQGGTGWSAPDLAPWLGQATEEASNSYFGMSAAYFGLGASIPFMAMLGEEYPDAQFLITGVLGPKSNAHGPNEFIHIPYVKKLTACIAYIIARHYELKTH